jgi:4-hydroxybenzoate polyprenyltransferase
VIAAAAAPLPLRLKSYLDERFPAVRYAILIASYYSSNQFLAQTLTRPSEPVHYDGSSVRGAIIVFCIFLHLRVFDEHKDYDEDCRHFPDRVLQRGLVTLDHLKVLGVLAIGVEFALAAYQGPAALAAVGVVFVFTLLMLKEFFLRDWLKRRFLLYAGVHMLIMPLLALLVYSVTTGRHSWQAPGWFCVYSFVGFFVTFNWEVSRKIRIPEEEIEGVDSYTRLFGTYGAAYVVLGVRVVDTLLVSLVGLHLGLSPWFYAVLVILFAVCMVGFLQYRFQTSAQTARRMELYAGIYIIAFDLALAAELARLHTLRVGAA